MNHLDELVVDTPLQLSKISTEGKKRLSRVSGDNLQRLGSVNQGGTRVVENYDYDLLFNKPIEIDTTEAWNSQPSLIAKEGHLYFYSDYKTVGGENIAGVKVGDGTSYLVDLPFLDSQFQEHIGDTIVHVTQEEREFWNNKNRAVVAGENLVLTDL